MLPFDANRVELRGLNLVEASAGTGKTHAITSLVVRLVVERGLPLERVLIVTFTEAAAAELKARIRARLARALGRFSAVGPATGDRRHAQAARLSDPAEAELDARLLEQQPPELVRARLSAALKGFDDAAISTIHGFCHRCLLETAFDSRSAFEAELVPDLTPLRDEVVRDYWALATSDAPRELLEQLKHRKIRLATCQALAARAVASPELRVLPWVTNPATPNPGKYNQAVSEAKQHFDRRAIERALLPSVHGTKLKNLPALLESVAEFLGVGQPDSRATPRALPARSELLAHSRLPLKNKHGRPNLPFLFSWQAVVEESEALQAAWDEQVGAFLTGLVIYAREEIPKRKLARGLISFDDLLSQLDQALAGPNGARLAARIRARFPAALIDEFQDTDGQQLRIFRRIYPAELLEAGGAETSSQTDDAGELGPLFLIGDPKQAIYSFRGADLLVYLEAAREAKPERRFTMGTNWRSDPALLRGLNALYSRLAEPFLLKGLGYPEVSPRPGAHERLCRADGTSDSPVQVVYVDRDLVQKVPLPELCAVEVHRLLTTGLLVHSQQGAERDSQGLTAPLAAGDIGVLTRTNQQAFDVQRALSARRIPSVVLGDQSVFASKEAQELLLLLRAAAEPSQTRLLKSSLITELVGLSATELQALETDDARWDSWVGRFRGWHQLWHERGFVQMLGKLLAELDSYERLLSLEDGERRLTNLLHLTELLHAAARSLHLGPAGLLSWLELQRGDTAERAESVQVRLESDERAVKITTIHKSKGLEYPVVLCPFLTVGRLTHDSERGQPIFHDADQRLTLAIALGDAARAEYVSRAETEQLQENLRLLYVALTRAKHRVIVHWGPVHSYKVSALGYLLHPPSRSWVHEETAAWLETHLKDKPLQTELESLAAELPELELRHAAADDGGPADLPEAAPPALSARRLEREVDQLYRTASFSGLTSHSASLQLDPDEGKDRDAGGDLTDNEPVLTPELALLSFPRGTKAGNFFHDVLEHHDFTRDEPSLLELVRRKLASHGYDASLAEDAARGLRRVLRTPLFSVPSQPDGPCPSEPDRNLCLADLPRAARLDELEFHFPVGLQLADLGNGAAPSRAIDTRARLSPRGLAEVFRRYPSSPNPAREGGVERLPEGYPARIEQLGFAPLSGFLKGYIDLVFRSPNRAGGQAGSGQDGRPAGRFYVVDYKSNYLGEHPRDYTPTRLREAMSHGHYYLQYHLYSLALHRYLIGRLPSYDYEQDFGGVLYLFLRGMAPELGAASGVFFEKPPLERLQLLSAVVDGAEQGALP